ncbi:MAG: TonB-dependent receptor [Sphingobium sp.]|uniref:TonB-dependent receptor domain-containing protein n=1 Tax=Sphingobium sp. TaxID=1912891 RepID=UPI0029BE9875|nr:TonB-dependent receptor [Sphingobium sp.]MDX3909915.1 TonB-dependent receptor [Sphingobium sp.]
MKTFSKRAILRASAAPAIIGASLIATVAFAQDTPQAADDASTDSIIVTGSRIARPEVEQASPISVVRSEEFTLRGQTNVENVLNSMPQVTGSTSGADNNPGGGVATVNLRNLGTQRTLVLVDGRRYISFDTTQVVDLNTVPSALIERVDVVTGGRSAVYGSDAIGGVVNFVLKQDFEGIELNSTYGVTSRGDGQYWDVNGTIGTNFADGRGNIVTHVGYYDRKSVYAGARGFARNALQIGRNSDGSPFTFFGGSGSVPQGRVTLPNADSSVVDFGSDGSITPYISSTDAYNYAPVNFLQVPQKRFLISTMARYEISDAFQPYLQGQFINNRVTGELAPTPIGNSTPIGTGADAGALGPIRLHVNSPFFSPATQATFRGLDTDGDGYISTSNYGFRTAGIGPRTQVDERNAFRILAGMKGDITSDWSYDGYYMYARTKNTQRQTGNVNLANFLGAVTTAFQNPTTGALSGNPFPGVAGGGNLVCANGSASCVPANLFGLGNLSSDAANYLGLGATNIEEYTTQVASIAFTNSNLFDLGAGGIGIALGAEWRKESGKTDPDQNLASGNVAGFNPGAPTQGSYSVTEFFGEVNVPLLADRPFANRLELNGAARYSNYSNAVGNVFTWAAGGLYEPIAGLGFRGQYQKAIRGPSVNELFLGQTVSFDGAEDPCGTDDAAVAGSTLGAACLAGGVPAAQLGSENLTNPDLVNPPTTVLGNSNLREEKSTTWTVGGVLTPRGLPGFSATVDYYNIKIDGYISRLGQSNLFQACYVYSLDQYCDAFSRNNQGQVERIVDTNLNSGGLKTNGIDVGLAYSFLIGDSSKIALSFNGSRLLKYDFTPIVGVPLVNECAGRFGNSCGQPTPKWKHSARATYINGPFTLSTSWRYLSKVTDDNDDVDFFYEKFKAQNYIDFAVAFEASDNFTLTGGVNNAFDKKPPLAASSQQGGNGEQSNTYPNVYDVMGRSFFVTGKLRF